MNSINKTIVRREVVKELSKKPIRTKKDIRPVSVRVIRKIQENRPSFWRRHRDFIIITTLLTAVSIYRRYRERKHANSLAIQRNDRMLKSFQKIIDNKLRRPTN